MQRAFGLLVILLLAFQMGCAAGKRVVAPTSAQAQALVASGNAALTKAYERMAAGDTVAAQELLVGIRQVSAEREARLNYLKALVASRSEEIDEAIAYAQAAFEASPEAPYIAALSLYVRLCAKAGRAEGAKSYVEELIEEDETNLTYLNLRDELRLALGEPQKLLRSTRQILKKDETNVSAMVNLARTYLGLKRPEQADYVVRRALEVEPEESMLYMLLAECRLALDDIQGGMRALEKSVELDPMLFEARNSLGVLYQQMGDSSSALEQLEEARRLAPAVSEVVLNLGNAHRGLRQYLEAESAYHKALSLQPDFPAAHFNLGILYLGSSVGGLSDVDRYKKAIEELKLFREASDDQRETTAEVGKFLTEAAELLKIAIEQAEMEAKMPEDEEEAPDEAMGDDDGDMGNVEPDESQGTGEDDEVGEEQEVEDTPEESELPEPGEDETVEDEEPQLGGEQLQGGACDRPKLRSVFPNSTGMILAPPLQVVEIKHV